MKIIIKLVFMNFLLNIIKYLDLVLRRNYVSTEFWFYFYYYWINVVMFSMLSVYIYILNNLFNNL